MASKVTDSLESPVDRQEFHARLRALGVPAALIEAAWPIVNGDAIGVLVYGSWARNDAQVHSDLDLLLAANRPAHSAGQDHVSVTVYSLDQLEGANRTLFGMHLARDGIIIHDTNRQLKRILSVFEPPDPERLLRRVRDFSVVLDVSHVDRTKYLHGLTQVARYLLRTALYAVALRDGRPCFSLTELSSRFREPELGNLLSSHAGIYPEPTDDVFDDLSRRLETIVGRRPENQFDSIHALIVMATKQGDADLASLATLALGTDDELPYSEIPKVVL